MCANDNACTKYNVYHNKRAQITCEFRGGKKYDQIPEADAVLYSSVFDDEKLSANPDELARMNELRRPDQIWSWFQWESPQFHREDLKPYDNFFNATLTYRYDSTGGFTINSRNVSNTMYSDLDRSSYQIADREMPADPKFSFKKYIKGSNFIEPLE